MAKCVLCFPLIHLNIELSLKVFGGFVYIDILAYNMDGYIFPLLLVQSQCSFHISFINSHMLSGFLMWL